MKKIMLLWIGLMGGFASFAPLAAQESPTILFTKCYEYSSKRENLYMTIYIHPNNKVSGYLTLSIYNPAGNNTYENEQEYWSFTGEIVNQAYVVTYQDQETDTWKIGFDALINEDKQVLRRTKSCNQ
ncbi:MAG TPA: hypothetical protein DCM08_09245 [Microscillaceae bacterium]|nr:hypothetical protein [Microscillaceae bacterium]